MGPTLVQVVWKCAMATPGALCAMISGMLVMQVWFADSLDSPDTVSVFNHANSFVLLKIQLSAVHDRKYISHLPFEEIQSHLKFTIIFMILHFNL